MKMLIPAFDQVKILVIGDIMLDRYLHGDTTRISPEAPVPVVNIKDTENRAGGAANVATNISALGAKAHLIGITGHDEPAKQLKKILTSNQVDCDFEQNPNIKTMTKVRVLSRHQQLIRLDYEDAFNVDDKAMLDRVKKAILHCDVVVLSDYAKGTLSHIEKIIKIANEHQVPVLIDPKGSDFTRYKGATLVTPNMNELEAVVGACKTESDIIKKGQALLESCNFKALLITRSEKGMTLITKDSKPYHLPTKAKEVFDVTGAGDTVIATLSVLLANGYSIKDSCYYANVAAGIVVGKLGTATLTHSELNQAVNAELKNITPNATNEQVIDLIAKAKQKGEKIVMTNGCFDILHAGHVSYLENAKKLGDKLVVAVNSDRSVKMLKGELRPINALNERMKVLAALSSVDFVISFDEETPERLIKQILPNVLVKGGDYEIDQIVGAKDVIANGGEVKVLNFEQGCSTTNIITKIKNQ